MAKNSESTSAAPAEPVLTDTEDQETDWQAEAEKWKKFSRKHEEAAKTNSEAAARLKEIEDAAKSAEQKALEELATYKSQAESATAQLLKYEVAASKNVPAALLNGATKEELEAQADALLAFRGEVPEAPAPTPNLRQGAQGESAQGDVNANLRAWSRR